VATTEVVTQASALESSRECVTAAMLRSPQRPTMSFPASLASWCPAFLCRSVSLSRHRLPSQTPLPRLNWALPLSESVVMVNMTDPIADRTVRQLDGYGLHDYVGRATPVTSSQTVSLLRMRYCEVEFTETNDNPSSPFPRILSYNALILRFHS
jgi:hypothetical protein